MCCQPCHVLPEFPKTLAPGRRRLTPTLLRQGEFQKDDGRLSADDPSGQQRLDPVGNRSCPGA